VHVFFPRKIEINILLVFCRRRSPTSDAFMGEEIGWETRKILHAGTLQLPSTFSSSLEAYFFQQDPDVVG
jgi:hypothetical protein